MLQPAGAASYSIAAVSKLTGISCHVLRVWERRYQFPIPDRAASGHRRYGVEQVGLLREIASRTQAGELIGELIGEYQEGRLAAVGSRGGATGDRSPAKLLVDLLAAGDLATTEAMLDRALDQLNPLDLIERQIEPALIEIGERWFQGESSIYQDRFALACLFNLIHRLTHRVRAANLHPRRRVLIGTVQGDCHEGGGMLLSLALELGGWRAISLGVDVPVPEFQRAIDAWKPDALALSFVLSRNIKKRFTELAAITGVPVFVGGRSILNHQALARRYGMVPLTGSLAATTAQLMLETETWHRRDRGATATDWGTAGPIAPPASIA